MRIAFQVLKFLDSVAALDSTGQYLNFFNVTEFKEFSSETVIMKNFPVFQLCCLIFVILSFSHYFHNFPYIP